MRPLSDHGSIQLALRVPPELAAEVAELEKEMAAASPYAKPTRSDVLREAVARGVVVLRRELARGGVSKKRGSR